MVLPTRLLSLLILSLCAFLPTRMASGEDLRQLYEQIHSANRLDAKGQTPFHIKIVAQIYDLDGEHPETATVEEWWAGGRFRIEVDESGNKSVQTSLANSERVPATRKAFLLRELLDQSVNPLNNLTEKAIFTSVDREVGGVKFRCLMESSKGATNESSTGPLFCTVPGSTDLRLMIIGLDFVEVRNQIARFHGAAIALKTSRLYLGKIAVSGAVQAIQSFDPTSSSYPEFREPELGLGGRDVTDRTIVAGHVLTQDRPVYPPTAEAGRKSGAVTLIALISREGRVASLDVLSSPTSVLSDAALKAVRNWTYSPFLSDGKPVDVQEFITVNFSR